MEVKTDNESVNDASPEMKPLLTFSVVACNQEKFIGDAIRGAFSQTYSPLEIILSDDASTDGTFKIMQELAAAYRGPHKIVLNQNPTNEGLARHVNRIARLAQGELVVAAAGDDISHPERTAVLFEAWDSTGRNAHCVHSRVAHIDEEGRPTAPPLWDTAAEPTHCIRTQDTSPIRYVETQQPEVFGCACAWSPTLFKVFGELPEDVIHEDNAIVLRSLLLGPLLFVDTPLVDYRQHQTNIFNSRSSKAHTLEDINAKKHRMRRDFARRAIMYRVFCSDLLTARSERFLSTGMIVSTYDLARRKERIFSLQRDFMTANIVKKAWMLLRLCAAGARFAQLRKLSVHLLPPSALLAAYKAKFHLPNLASPETSRSS